MKTKKFILVAFILTLFNSLGTPEAKAEIFCAYRNAYGLYFRMSLLGDDKISHCALSCSVALKCPAGEVALLGLLKEFYDVFTPGDASMRDMVANSIGIALADKKAVEDSMGCINACRLIYTR